MEQEKATAKAAETITQKEAPVTVKLKDGREIQIVKCRVRDLAPVLKLVIHIFESLSPKDEKGKPIPGEVNLTEVTQTQILQLIATSSDLLFEAVSVLCTLSFKELEELELDDAIDTIVAVWEVNQDFFLKNVLPRVGGLLVSQST